MTILPRSKDFSFEVNLKTLMIFIILYQLSMNEKPDRGLASAKFMHLYRLKLYVTSFFTLEYILSAAA